MPNLIDTYTDTDDVVWYYVESLPVNYPKNVNYLHLKCIVCSKLYIEEDFQTVLWGYCAGEPLYFIDTIMKKPIVFLEEDKPFCSPECKLTNYTNTNKI